MCETCSNTFLQQANGPVRRFCDECRLSRREDYAKRCQNPKFREVRNSEARKRRCSLEIRKAERDYQREHRKNPTVAAAQREYQRRYRQTIEGKSGHRQRERKRRALKQSQAGMWPDISSIEVEYSLWITQEKLCFYCNESIKSPLSLRGDFHMDHYIPLARGGKHCITNAVLTCPPCNSKKHTMTGDEFIKGTG